MNSTAFPNRQTPSGPIDVALAALHACPVAPCTAALEDYFAVWDGTAPEDFAKRIAALTDSHCWQALSYPDNPYPQLCIALAQSIDAHQAQQDREPAYHNRAHFQDVCLAITAFASRAPAPPASALGAPWQLSAEDWWILLFCALAHDYGHPGTRNHTPFELEKYAVDLTQTFLLEQAHPLLQAKSLLADVEAVVLATEPQCFLELTAPFRNATPTVSRQALMGLLLVEADLCASVLPQRGVWLGERLAKEWSTLDQALAQMVQSPQGRKRFLQSIAFYSPYAQSFGLEELRQQLLHALSS